jgi:hypothetical protein
LPSRKEARTMSVSRSIYSWRIGSTVQHDETPTSPRCNCRKLPSTHTRSSWQLELSLVTVCFLVAESSRNQGQKNKLPGVVSEAEFLDRKEGEKRGGPDGCAPHPTETRNLYDTIAFGWELPVVSLMVDQFNSSLVPVHTSDETSKFISSDLPSNARVVPQCDGT